MKFLDYITIGDILFLPPGLGKYEAIRYMVTNAACFKSEHWRGETDRVMRAILKREELGSTGIGRGIACPHTKGHLAWGDMSAVFGHSAQGVDFDSLDGEPVNVFFLWAVESVVLHMTFLENISRQMRNDTLFTFLKQATSPDEILQLLKKADNSEFVT